MIISVQIIIELFKRSFVMSEPLGDNILRLRGLPRQATRDDVFSFLIGKLLRY